MSFFPRASLIATLIAAVAGTTALSLAAPRRSPTASIEPVPGQAEVLPAPPQVAPAEPRAMLPVVPQQLARIAPPKYRVRVKRHRTFRKTCCGACAVRQIVLDVQDPCNRPVAFPVHVPGCCPGDPVVLKDRDIFGRFSYTYRWASGYKIDVVFRPRGDIVVHTWGR